MKETERAPQAGDAPMTVTVQEYWSTAVAVFAIGCLAGWAMFGSPRQVDRVLDSESLANWIAAIGTWAVGYMAWKIARDAERQRRAERLESARLAREMRISRRFSVIRKISVLMRTNAVWEGLESSETRLREEGRMLIEMMLEIISRNCILAEERGCFTAAENSKLRVFEDAVERVRLSIQWMSKHIAPGFERLTDDEFNSLMQLRTFTHSVEQMGEQLVQALSDKEENQ